MDIVQGTTILHTEIQMEIDRYWQKVKFLLFAKFSKMCGFWAYAVNVLYNMR